MTIIDRRTETLAGRLRSARLFAGIDQKDIAADLGVNRATISLWENGHNDIPATKLLRWAEMTRVALDWIAYGSVRPEGFEPPTYWSVASDEASAWCWDERHEMCSGFDCTCGCHDDETPGPPRMYGPEAIAPGNAPGSLCRSALGLAA